MVHYVWQSRNWPNFKWNSDALLRPLGQTRQSQGRLLGEAEYIGLEMQAAVLTEEAFTTAAIEGEKLDRQAIKSADLSTSAGIERNDNLLIIITKRRIPDGCIATRRHEVCA